MQYLVLRDNTETGTFTWFPSISAGRSSSNQHGFPYEEDLDGDFYLVPSISAGRSSSNQHGFPYEEDLDCRNGKLYFIARQDHQEGVHTSNWTPFNGLETSLRFYALMGVQLEFVYVVA
jgi:hypothetical protein